MKTVGEILKNSRESQNLSLDEIAGKTKIAKAYLLAIEANDFKHLPAATFTKGFLKNYAVVLNLNPENILAIFRRDYDQDERGRIIPRGLTEPVKAPLTFITPGRISLIISAFLGLIIAIFFIRQILIFTQAPALELFEPAANNQSLTSPVNVSGKTHPEAAVSINNEPTTVNKDGTFTKAMNFSEGEHTLIVVASSRNGNSRSLQRVITVLVDKKEENP